MWPFAPSTTSYQPVLSDPDLENSDSKDAAPATPEKSSKFRLFVAVFITLLIGSIIVFFGSALMYDVLSRHVESSTQNAGTTTNIVEASPGLRREWRTLAQPEKDHYITSVRCLLANPSIFPTHVAQNSTLYEDFPWIHSHAGYRTHKSASFLPWHRYFLHIYESTLRGACGFTGELVYWDWVLDAEDLANAPVFDAVTGFGGDGEAGGEVSVGKTGRCVVDGPFSDVVAKFYDVEFQPHCLSRGFVDDEGRLGHINGDMVRAESIEEVLALDDYEQFVLKLESVVHDTIPFGVGGDFWTFTAPYDPLFYLHHTQLDRLWYIWQQRDPENRLMAYNGHGQRHSVQMASLSDKLSMQGLAPDIEVEKVMLTEGELLHYRY